MAVLVGHNVGSGARPDLRYAEQDAAKLARVLVELGGFDPHDVQLLRGPALQQVRAALDRVSTDIQRLASDQQTKVMLLFYYSGHSDGQALELGAERLLFGELRRRLQGSGAAVRLEIVDSCKSGALLRDKGGDLAPGFEVRMTDDVSSTGEAVLTSSAEDESALESFEIGGSYFSHHLVSGLRGAADVSGDGRVTLSEAYQYAFLHTVAATYDTIPGPQRPNYRYNLSGQGDLVLTEVTHRSALVQLPPGYDRLLIEDLSSAAMLAEVRDRAPSRLALPPGRYKVTAVREDRRFTATIQIGPHEQRILREQDLALERREAIALLPKGDLATVYRPTENGRALFSALAGMASGVAQGRFIAFTGQLGFRQHPAGGWDANLTYARGRGTSFREQAAFATVGWGLGLAGRRMFGRASVRAGGGAVWQSLPGAGGTIWTPAGTAGLDIGGGAFLNSRMALTLQSWLPAVLLRRDQRLQVITLPAVTGGLILAWR